MTVSFRVVGIYAYFENLDLPSVNPNSTVKEVMDAIVKARPEFSYLTMTLPSGKELVNEMTYTFGPGSTKPYSSSQPSPGKRSIPMNIANNGISHIWQYYRSVSGSINGEVAEVKLFNDGQPSFAERPIGANNSRFGVIPSGFNVSTYNLTWRLVAIEMQPPVQAMFLAAQAKSMAGKY